MSLAAVVERIQSSLGTALEVVVTPAPASLEEMLRELTDIGCSAAEFEGKAHRLSPQQAQTLLTATLHRSMAYGEELLPLERARQLAQQFVDAAGSNASFFSNCAATDEVSSVGGWSFMVTTHTFESVLYCVSQRESALLVAVDED